MSEDLSAEQAQVRLEMIGGQSCLRVAGEQVPALGYCSSILDPEQLRLFADAGVRIISFPTTCDHHLYDLARGVWKAPGTYDWSELDERMARVCEAVPKAYILPRVFSSSPPWWDRLYPDDLVQWEDGSTHAELLHGANKSQVPSLASPRWWQARRENLRRYLRHLEDGPFASRIIGYHVTSGNSEEWFHWGVMEHRHFDYSRPMVAHFRSWLEERYGSVDALSQAWGRSLCFEEVEIPDPERRPFNAPFRFRKLPEEADIIDFARCLALLTADSIRDLARVVKTESQGNKLFGTFYGYLLELAFHPDGLAFGGHLALDSLLSQKEGVDFLASPGSYARRTMGEGFSQSMLPAESLANRGVASFHENDVRTHLLVDDAGYGRTADSFETASVQFRELGSALTRGQGLWWFDMSGGWFDDPEVKEAIADSVKIVQTLGDRPREGVAEVAYVIDEESCFHVQAAPNQMIESLVRPLHELSRVGAPYDVLLHQDLEVDRPYRLLIFPNLFRLSASLEERLHRLLAGWEATALWLGPVAGAMPHAIAAAHSLTGFELARGEREPQVARTLSGECYGSPRIHLPSSRIVAPKGGSLAHFQHSGDTAMAELRHPQGWRSVISTVPAVPAAQLRRFLTQAGGQLYIDSADGLDACNRLIALHARDAGVKRLRVPDCDHLYDLRSRVEIQPKGGVFSLFLPRAETALLFRGSREEWDGGLSDPGSL